MLAIAAEMSPAARMESRSCSIRSRRKLADGSSCAHTPSGSPCQGEEDGEGNGEGDMGRISVIRTNALGLRSVDTVYTSVAIGSKIWPT